MSLQIDIQDLDAETLDKITLPGSRKETRGLSDVKFAKLVNLAFVVNKTLDDQTHLIDNSILAAAITAAGRTFTAPIDARLVVYSAIFVYTATATVGNRTVAIRRDAKTGPNTSLNTYLFPTITANQVWTLQVAPHNGTIGAQSQTAQLTGPIILEPEWKIIIDDIANIDNNDVVTAAFEFSKVRI